MDFTSQKKMDLFQQLCLSTMGKYGLHSASPLVHHHCQNMLNGRQRGVFFPVPDTLRFFAKSLSITEKIPTGDVSILWNQCKL